MPWVSLHPDLRQASQRFRGGVEANFHVLLMSGGCSRPVFALQMLDVWESFEQFDSTQRSFCVEVHDMSEVSPQSGFPTAISRENRRRRQEVEMARWPSISIS